MTPRTWHSGLPPAIGWYNTSISKSLAAWRWWNGKHWSLFCKASDKINAVKFYATIPTNLRGSIKWTTYWPENARVPDTRNLPKELI